MDFSVEISGVFAGTNSLTQILLFKLGYSIQMLNDQDNFNFFKQTKEKQKCLFFEIKMRASPLSNLLPKNKHQN